MNDSADGSAKIELFYKGNLKCVMTVRTNSELPFNTIVSEAAKATATETKATASAKT